LPPARRRPPTPLAGGSISRTIEFHYRTYGCSPRRQACPRSAQGSG
jgi:hypothetical protein